MSVPPISHPVWMQLLQGNMGWQLESLPIKIFLGTAQLQLAGDPSPTHLGKLAHELREVFLQNEKLPSVQRDLARFK